MQINSEHHNQMRTSVRTNTHCEIPEDKLTIMTPEPKTEDDNQFTTRHYHTKIQNDAMATIKMKRHKCVSNAFEFKLDRSSDPQPLPEDMR